jgi:hypothetical protein
LPVFPWCSRSFFQPLHKDGHFLFRLAVALLARRLDAARVGIARFFTFAGIGKRAA